MKKWTASLFALAIIVVSANVSEVYAQKNSGKSFSSGSSSSSRPSSSSSSGKSFSSGSTPKPSSSPKPATPSTGSSGKSFSSGSSKPATPSPTPSTSKATPSGRSFSTGNSSSSSTNSTKPISSGWNPGLSTAAKKEESKKNYIAATKPAETPKSTYRTSSGVEKPLKADSPDVATVRRYVTHERYVTYDNRANVFYGSYYRAEPYNDYFHPFLMGMLFSEAWNSHQRALWVYHHYDPLNPYNSISEERYRELLRRDARLQAELDVLRAQNMARDPSYIPPQYQDNPDLMYDKSFVEASYNPQPVSSGISVGKFFMWLGIIVGIVILIGFIYVMFIRDYP